MTRKSRKHTHNPSRAKLLVFLVAVILLIATPTYLLLQSSFLVPENDVWIRNTNNIYANGQSRNTASWTCGGIPLTVWGRMAFKPNFNDSLGNQYLIDMPYEVWQVSNSGGTPAPLVSGAITGTYSKSTELFIWINCTTSGWSVQSVHYVQYIIIIKQIMLTIESRDFFLKNAYVINFIVQWTGSSFSASIQLLNASDLMFAPVGSGGGIDQDHDGLSDPTEITIGSNPNDPDSDHDGLLDGVEMTLGTDLISSDTDGDTYTDYTEVIVYNTDPLDPLDFPDFSEPPPTPPKFDFLFWGLVVGLPILILTAVGVLLWRRRK